MPRATAIVPVADCPYFQKKVEPTIILEKWHTFSPQEMLAPAQSLRLTVKSEPPTII